ncbi:kinase-like domain-containing protein [Blastocladiella britannica]|nr:kinase-like domain-containing protein [Blastocladiella britannica]
MSASPNIVGVHYKVGRKIGEGSFGVIYEGTNLLNNTLVGIKFESRKSEAPQLRDEFRTYKILAGCEGIPLSYYFGQEGLHNILVIDLLGPSLEDAFDMCGRKFTIKTTCMLAKAMITRVWSVHEKSLIYRDIKPDNFLIGRPGSRNQATVYMIDFGMAKHYRDPKTKQHIPYRERKSLSGTARYMSINTHLGREQSRRDDLEALGHVFFYFLRGSLPWQGLKAQTNKQKYEKIGEKKQMTPVSELAERCPTEFADYLTYARKLGFEEEPDYRYLLQLMDSCLQRHGLVDDQVFDWMASEQWNQLCANSRYAAQQAAAAAVDPVASSSGVGAVAQDPYASASRTNRYSAQAGTGAPGYGSTGPNMSASALHSHSVGGTQQRPALADASHVATHTSAGRMHATDPHSVPAPAQAQAQHQHQQQQQVAAVAPPSPVPAKIPLWRRMFCCGAGSHEA